MAKVTFGAVVAGARGRVAGIVYSRNQWGNFVRARGTVTNVPSARRSFVRDNLATLDAVWETTLTPTQRAAWMNFATAHALTRTRSSDKQSTGRQGFLKLNARLLNAGETYVADPPDDLTVTPLTSLEVSATAGTPGTMTITFTPATIPAGHILEVWASAPRSSARYSFQGHLRWLAAYPAGSTSPLDITAEYSARFGNITGPNSYGTGAALLKIISGSRSQRFEDRTTTS